VSGLENRVRPHAKSSSPFTLGFAGSASGWDSRNTLVPGPPQSFSETALVRGEVPAIRSPNLCQA
jgi:hypothetical protein